MKAGKTESVLESQEEAPAYADNVIDHTQLLQRSLKGGRASNKAPTAIRKNVIANGKKVARGKVVAKQTSAKTSKTVNRARKAR